MNGTRKKGEPGKKQCAAQWSAKLSLSRSHTPIVAPADVGSPDSSALTDREVAMVESAEQSSTVAFNVVDVLKTVAINMKQEEQLGETLR